MRAIQSPMLNHYPVSNDLEPHFRWELHSLISKKKNTLTCYFLYNEPNSSHFENYDILPAVSILGFDSPCCAHYQSFELGWESSQRTHGHELC